MEVRKASFFSNKAQNYECKSVVTINPSSKYYTNKLYKFQRVAPKATGARYRFLSPLEKFSQMPSLSACFEIAIIFLCCFVRATNYLVHLSRNGNQHIANQTTIHINASHNVSNNYAEISLKCLHRKSSSLGTSGTS